MTGFEYLDNGGLPIAIAHRGGLAETEREGLPENSREAFGYAADLGYRYLETDVRATAKGKLHVWHGQGVERIDKRRPLDEADAELAPLLSDVLEEFPETRFAIDPKHWPAVEPLAEVLVAMNALGRVSVGAFSQKRTDEVAKLVYERSHAEICTAMGPRHLSQLAVRAAIAPNRLWRAPNPAVQIPRTISTERIISAAHAGGAQVHTWVVNTPTEMNDFLDLGVDGIMTDEPSLLKGILQSRGQWQ
jgi:glycerophosphoryl diester phosphodiesterase